MTAKVATPDTLEQILADARGNAAVLRSHGHFAEADALESLCDSVQAATPEYRTWLSETEAQLFSGRTEVWLRQRHEAWMARGLAKLEGRRRFYRQCVLEHRGNLEAARRAGGAAA